MMFEFCCSDKSKLGEVNKSKDIDHMRLSLSNCDLEDETHIKSLLAMIDRFKGADMWSSIRCGPWSPWQQMACIGTERSINAFWTSKDRKVGNYSHISL